MNGWFDVSPDSKAPQTLFKPANLGTLD